MKRMVCLMMTVLMVLGAVSCKKKDPDDIRNYWKVQSTHGNDGGSDLNYAWYFYNADRGGYSIVLSSKDNLDTYYLDDYVWVDFPKLRCGEKHSLTETLSVSEGSGWTFIGGTSTVSFVDGGFTEGTVSLTVNEEKDKILFQMHGTLKSNDKIRVRYSGKATRVDKYIGRN